MQFVSCCISCSRWWGSNIMLLGTAFCITHCLGIEWMIYWTTKNIQQDTQVPRQNTNTCPKKQKASKLLTFNRHIKHIKTQQAPTINWLCISIAPTKTQTKKEQKNKNTKSLQTLAYKQAYQTMLRIFIVWINEKIGKFINVLKRYSQYLHS